MKKMWDLPQIHEVDLERKRVKNVLSSHQDPLQALVGQAVTKNGWVSAIIILNKHVLD